MSENANALFPFVIKPMVFFYLSNLYLKIKYPYFTIYTIIKYLKYYVLLYIYSGTTAEFITRIN